MLRVPGTPNAMAKDLKNPFPVLVQCTPMPRIRLLFRNVYRRVVVRVPVNVSPSWTALCLDRHNVGKPAKKIFSPECISCTGSVPVCPYLAVLYSFCSPPTNATLRSAWSPSRSGSGGLQTLTDSAEWYTSEQQNRKGNEVLSPD
jgi:hypothetical protein